LTRGGGDALRKTLQRNRELYRYEDSELGDLEGVLGEYLSENTFAEVVKNVRSGGWWGGGGGGQRQKVSNEQVASLESVVPDVIESPVDEAYMEGEDFEASPPILREDISSDMKILTTDAKYTKLNGFGTFLGLSDRLINTESPFFRTPHSTRIIWGGHRVIYIFTNVTGELSLYYDIELRDPIEQKKAGGRIVSDDDAHDRKAHLHTSSRRTRRRIQGRYGLPGVLRTVRLCSPVRPTCHKRDCQTTSPTTPTDEVRITPTQSIIQQRFDSVQRDIRDVGASTLVRNGIPGTE
jgi:hypothetical protein